jgi:hypothetical protein
MLCFVGFGTQASTVAEVKKSSGLEANDTLALRSLFFVSSRFESMENYFHNMSILGECIDLLCVQAVGGVEKAAERWRWPKEAAARCRRMAAS